MDKPSGMSPDLLPPARAHRVRPIGRLGPPNPDSDNQWVVGGDPECAHEWNWDEPDIRAGCRCTSCRSWPCRKCSARFEP